MLTKDNVTIGIEWRFGSDWPGQRCGAKMLVGFFSSGPQTFNRLDSLAACNNITQSNTPVFDNFHWATGHIPVAPFSGHDEPFILAAHTGETMFVSFTDWEFDGDVDKAVEGIKANWAAMKEYGAVNTRCTVTGENTLRTMTLWKSQETLDENVDKIRALATSASGMAPTSGMKGPLAIELD